jgi:hypothetical protein
VATTIAARRQSSSKASGAKVRDKQTVGEPADAAGRIANDTFAERLVVDVAAVAVGGEPLADREGIAAAAMKREPAVGAADREGAAVGGYQHVGHRGTRCECNGDEDKNRAAPA